MDHLPARRRTLLAALASAAAWGLVALPAAAKPAYTDPAMRAQVRAGMTADEVTQRLGRPSKTRKYRAGSSWGYKLGPENWFEVDFDADGRVKAAAEQVIPAW